MRKIKILHLITRLIVGGAQEIALSIASQLDRDKFNVVFASGPQDFSKEMANKWNIEVVTIPGLMREINPINDSRALANLYFFIKNNRFDIVHTHTSKAGILGRIAARLAGTPLIFHTPHGSVFHSIYYGPRGIYLLSRLENFVARFTDKIITCSKNERDDFLEHKIGNIDKYAIIYWGIKQDAFLKEYDIPQKRGELGIPQDAVVIGNITRLVPEKGHLFCLEAFKIVVKSFPRVILLIAGDGVLKKTIQAKVKELNLNDNVIMTGYREDAAEIFAALDISLHTSIWEGTPIAVMEAMLSGKAVIATNVGGIPELIEDGAAGILVPRYDKETLAKAIIGLINDRNRAEKMGQAARQIAKEKFKLKALVENITNLYDSHFDR